MIQGRLGFLGSVPLGGAGRPAWLSASPPAPRLARRMGQSLPDINSLVGNQMVTAGLLAAAGVIFLSKGQISKGFPADAATVLAFLLGVGGAVNGLYGLLKS